MNNTAFILLLVLVMPASAYNMSWDECGTYNIAVNGTNQNGTTDTATWTVHVSCPTPPHHSSRGGSGLFFNNGDDDMFDDENKSLPFIDGEVKDSPSNTYLDDNVSSMCISDTKNKKGSAISIIAIVIIVIFFALAVYFKRK